MHLIGWQAALSLPPVSIWKAILAVTPNAILELMMMLIQMVPLKMIKDTIKVPCMARKLGSLKIF